MAPGHGKKPLTKKAAEKRKAARGAMESARVGEVQAAARTTRGATARERKAGVSDRQVQRTGTPPEGADFNERSELEGTRLTDEEQDAILTEIEQKHGIQTEEEDPLAKFKPLYEDEDRGDGRDTKGRFTPEDEDDEDDEFSDETGFVDAELEEEEGEEEEGEEEEDERPRLRRKKGDDDELSDAMRALRGALGKDAAETLMDKMSDDEILDAADHAIKRERAIQRKLSDNGRRQTGDRGLETSGDPRAEEPAGKTGGSTLKSDLDAAAKLITEELVGTDGGEVVSKAFLGLQEQNQRLETALGDSHSLTEALLKRSSRADLVSKGYPELSKNDRLFEKVWKKADTLHRAGTENGEYSEGLAGIDEALLDAARVVLKGRPKARQVSLEGESKRQASKAGGSPKAPRQRSQNGTVLRNMTQDEFETRVLTALEAGDPKEAARLRSLAERGFVVPNPVEEPLSGF